MAIADFFNDNYRYGIAFSGGVDSTYLLNEAIKAGADVRAYYVKTAFQPEFEREDARNAARRLDAEFSEIELDILSCEAVVSNPEDRCYYCKQNIMGAIMEAARKDGCDVLCDGTNADDDVSDRPGYRALQEIGVRSPLKECGITKDEIRRGLKEDGFEIWDKPAYACLATRILTGERIDEDKLRKTEEAERIIYEMGFRDFRVRQRNNNALVQVKEDRLAEAFAKEKEIKRVLGQIYDTVKIDEKGR